MVDRELALDLDLFSRGGLEILRAIERRDYDVLERAAGDLKTHQARAGSARRQRQDCCHFCASGRARQGRRLDAGTNIGRSLRHVPGNRQTRSEELLLRLSRAARRARKNAICAIYAFMRKADDLADDESLPREERRRQLDAWLAAWHAAAVRVRHTDPVFIAVRDAIQRFTIPLSLLDELVAGTTMDLETARRRRAGYLRHVCRSSTATAIWSRRSWAWSASASSATHDPRAEKLAEETGIAFQLTNILRDVRRTQRAIASIFRSTTCRAHGVSLDSLLHRSARHSADARTSELCWQRWRSSAEDYYRSAEALLPLIDPREPAGLWVLVSIYHALLKRIRGADYDVFSQRASVPLLRSLRFWPGDWRMLLSARVSG